VANAMMTTIQESLLNKQKFIKDYAYLAKRLSITNSNKLTPILFFFTNKKMNGNIYIVEGSNINRDKNFF
jgi:hypothetical protein